MGKKPATELGIPLVAETNTVQELAATWQPTIEYVRKQWKEQYGEARYLMVWHTRGPPCQDFVQKGVGSKVMGFLGTRSVAMFEYHELSFTMSKHRQDREHIALVMEEHVMGEHEYHLIRDILGLTLSIGDPVGSMASGRRCWATSWPVPMKRAPTLCYDLDKLLGDLNKLQFMEYAKLCRPTRVFKPKQPPEGHRFRIQGRSCTHYQASQLWARSTSQWRANYLHQMACPTPQSEHVKSGAEDWLSPRSARDAIKLRSWLEVYWPVASQAIMPADINVLEVALGRFPWKNLAVH